MGYCIRIDSEFKRADFQINDLVQTQEHLGDMVA